MKNLYIYENYIKNGEFMTEELKVKINDSIKEKFVGNTIFTNDELNEMYNLSSCILRNVANTWGSTIKYSDYSLIFVTLVNIAKEWNSEEDAFFEYVYKKLLLREFDDGNYVSGKIYTQLVNVITKVCKDRNVFMINSFKKKYYATLCSHSFAPLSSIESFFDLCWIIYCNDLEEQYIKNDVAFQLIAESLQNKFSNNNDEDDFVIGSKAYSIRAGIRGLALDRQDLMIYLIEDTISSINFLFNNEPISLNTQMHVLLSNWWKAKELLFGEERKKHGKRVSIVSDYSLIRPKYVLEDNCVKLKIPAIRLRNNFDYEPYLELKVDGEKKYCEPLAIKGSGILMQTKSMEFDIANFVSNNINIEITHRDNIIYNSKDSLNRSYILFKDSKEIISDECIPGVYNLFIRDFNILLQKPFDIHRFGKNPYIYSLEAQEGDLLQSSNKTIFFFNEKTNRELYFFANQNSEAIYRYRDSEYKVIDGDLYIVCDKNKAKEYGVRYEETFFKLTDFELVDGLSKFCISSLLDVGQPQKISVFKYSDNSIISRINLIKFKDIRITFDKKVYYGNDSSGEVKFVTEKYFEKQVFNINQQEISIPLEGGEIIVNPPTIRWKIDDGSWNNKPFKNGLWYKDITNSSVMTIEMPKDMNLVLCLNDNIVEQFSSNHDFKLGQTIYALKEFNKYTKPLILFLKTENDEYFDCGDVYLNETFIDNPFFIFSMRNEIYWNPSGFVGDKNSDFRLDIIFNEKVLESRSLKSKKEKLDFDNLEENKYFMNLYLISKGFLKSEKLIYSSDFVFGDERNIEYKNKKIFINKAKLFNCVDDVLIKSIYIDNIKFLSIQNGQKLYSGSIFVVDKDGKKIYLNAMKKIDGSYCKINPVRIEFINNKFLYMGYGLDYYDDEYDFDNEFTLDEFGKITNCLKSNGKKNRSIDYFIYEVI